MASPAALRGSVCISFPTHEDPAYNPFSRCFHDAQMTEKKFSLSEVHHGAVLIPPHAHATLHSPDCGEELRWEDVEAFLSLSDKFESMVLLTEQLSCGGWWNEMLKALASDSQRWSHMLELHGHQLSPAEMRSLAEFLRLIPDQISHLRKLSLSSCDEQSEEDDYRYLVEALQSPHCRLQSLSCSDSPDLVRALLRNNGLARCSFSSLELSPMCPQAHISEGNIATLDLPLSKLTALRLSGRLSFDNLAHALEDPNCSLQELYLDQVEMSNEGMDISNKGMEMLMKALQTTNSKCKLKVLYLRQKHMGMKSLQYLCKILIDLHSELEMLYIQADSPSMPPGYIAEALESEHCRLLGLSLHGDMFTYVLDEQLLKALCNPNCKLHSITVRSSYLTDRTLQLIGNVLISDHSQLLSVDISSSLVYRRVDEKFRVIFSSMEYDTVDKKGVSEKHLVAALEKNFKLTTPLFDFKDGNLKARCSVLLERNRSLAKGGLQQQEWVRPKRARMFICGHPGVGKTTLRKGLQKVSRRRNIVQKVVGKALSSCVCTEEASTRGIEVEALSFGEDQIVLYDLAGQKEYHAFHHLFVGGDSKDMSVIVCKHDRHMRRNQDGIESMLRYWLRFIVSHNSVSSDIKPHVIVVLNFFNSTYADDQMTEVVNDCTKKLLEDEGFGMVLDFGEGNNRNNIFGIDAQRASHLGHIYTNLEPMLIKLLDEKPIPQVCNQLSSIILGTPTKPVWISVLKSRKAKPFLLSYPSVVKQYSEDFQKEQSDETFDAALNELHNTGQIVYFRTQVEREKQIIISDCGQFCHKLVGALLEPDNLKGREGDQDLVQHPRSWLWKQEDIKDILRNAAQSCNDHLHGLLSYLEKLELLYRVNRDEFLVPALLGEETLSWPFISNEATHKYIGRRLECADKEKINMEASF